MIYDGHELDQLFIVGEPEFNLHNSQPDYRQVSGRDGSYVSDVTLGNSTVSVTLSLVGSDTERRSKLSTLGHWLRVDSPRKLVLPNMPNVYFLAVPDGEFSTTRGVDGEHGKLTFVIVEPAGYGTERTITVPSGGSVTFSVGGTYPTKPVITATATRDATSLVWGVRLDSADFVHVPTGVAAAREVEVDCENRTCLVNDIASMVTLNSNWLEFEPGEHTLTMDYGTGVATVTYVERWL